jgi:spore coat protein U-like protein
MKPSIVLSLCSSIAITTLPSFVGAVPTSGRSYACIISNTTPLTFDAADNTNYAQDGRASFRITCAHTQTTIVSLMYSHRMRSATQGGELSYDLYSTPNHSLVWGSGSDGGGVSEAFIGGKSTIVYIYAHIPAHQTPLSGQFSDRIDIVTSP